MEKLKTLLILLFATTSVLAQKSNKEMHPAIIGTWNLVAVQNTNSDGTKTFPYGTNPKGILFFDEKGNYAVQIYKNERPQIVSGDKNKCTPEENTSIVQGSNSHFGTYEIDEMDKILIFKIKIASFPNWENTEQKRSYILDHNQIKYVVTNTTQGGNKVTAEVVWQKF